MCGVVYAKDAKGGKVNSNIWARYKHQKHRGVEGYGFIAIKNGVFQCVYRSRYEKQINEYLMESDADEIIFHHRAPTSGENLIGSTHPMEISDSKLKYDYLIIHNGTITNTEKLKAKHEVLGYTYKTEHEIAETYTFVNSDYPTEKRKVKLNHNDSESIALEVALFLEGKSESIDTVGGAAIIGIAINKKNKKVESFFYGHNDGRPLIEEKSGKRKKKRGIEILVLKSEGAGTAIATDRLFVHDPKANTTIGYDLPIGKFEKPYKAGYRYEADYSGGEDVINLPAPKSYDDNATFDDYQEEIDMLVDKIAEAEMEIYECQGYLETETNISVRGNYRKHIIEQTSELKKMRDRLDDAYWFQENCCFA